MVFAVSADVLEMFSECITEGLLTDTHTADAPSVHFTKPSFEVKAVHSHMLSIFSDIYARYGPRYSEALYQRLIARRAYLDGLPVMTERELFMDIGEGSFLAGRIDLEVAGKCLYEFKVGSPNISKDSFQLNRYLNVYDINKETIQVASLVYFTASGVVVHVVRNYT